MSFRYLTFFNASWTCGWTLQVGLVLLRLLPYLLNNINNSRKLSHTFLVFSDIQPGFHEMLQR